MRRITRGSIVVLATAATLSLGMTAAQAAFQAGWRTANECALLTIDGCSVATIATSTRVTVDDGGCAQDVGLGIKVGSTTYAPIFAATSVSRTGNGITQYNAWHA